tara:strand:- start:1510 stop:1698 length:189 start_codon:yes stop_codon:yes gene_type:complete
MNKNNKNLHKALSISSTLIGSIVFCGAIGYILKNKFNNDWLLVYLLIIGAFLGLYELYKQIR